MIKGFIYGIQGQIDKEMPIKVLQHKKKLEAYGHISRYKIEHKICRVYVIIVLYVRLATNNVTKVKS